MIVRKRKYYHGGVHTTGPTGPSREERIPPSQRQREQVPYDPIYNPSGGVLGGNFLEQARQQVADITFPYAFGPYGAARGEARVGDVLGVGSDFTPYVGDAKEAARIQQDLSEGNYLDAAIGAGLFVIPGAIASKAGPYIKRGAERVMNFLRPAADEIADAATAGFGSIRPNIAREQLKAMGPEQLQEGLETSNRLLKERMDEFFSDEGQRRARQQIEDQVTYYDRLSRAPDETLERLGFDKAQRVVLRRGMQKYRGADGAIDLNSAAIAKDLADFNARMRGVANRSGEVVQRANMAVKSDEAIVNLRRLRNEAYDAGDYQRVADLEDQILQTQQAALTRDQLIDQELTNAFYQQSGGQRSIMLGRENLADPDYATSATIHELQHAFQDVPSRVPYVGAKLGRTVEADRILDDLVLIDRRNPNITTGKDDPLWDDLGYFQQRKKGRLTEKTPFLSEMREDMLSKGYISHRHQEVTDNLMDRYLKDYYGARNVSTPSTDVGNKNVRILEIMDPNTGGYNRGVLKDALNKMLVAVPAVGAAGVAAGTTADDGSSYYKGGKLKLKKEKRCGMRVV